MYLLKVPVDIFSDVILRIGDEGRIARLVASHGLGKPEATLLDQVIELVLCTYQVGVTTGGPENITEVVQYQKLAGLYISLDDARKRSRSCSRFSTGRCFAAVRHLLIYR